MTTRPCDFCGALIIVLEDSNKLCPKCYENLLLARVAVERKDYRRHTESLVSRINKIREMYSGLKGEAV